MTSCISREVECVQQTQKIQTAIERCYLKKIIPISSPRLNLPVSSLSLTEHNLQSPEIKRGTNINISQIPEWFDILYFHDVVYDD